MNYTKEQLDAIYTSGQNIIVSAGAGSGKTAVLTERIINKLKNGVYVDELLVLTFTELAALEMKNRVRSKMLLDEDVKSQIDLLDSAYITTFDSFCYSIIKKYNYVLNIPKDINIVDNSLININKMSIMTNVFDELYSASTKDFYTFISTFCDKDDKTLKQDIIRISDRITLIKDRDEFLTSYQEKYFNEEKVAEDIDQYEKYLLSRLAEIKDLIDTICSYCSEKERDNLVKVTSQLINSRTYEELVDAIKFRMPSIKNSCQELADCKEKLKKLKDELKKCLIWSSKDDIKASIMKMKTNVEVIIKILNKYYEYLSIYKKENNIYEFIDIELLAIKLLENNPVIREELKNSFKEILIDEYQDTNDLQEALVSMIANNNVYMVGDIKQSIYGFRNANPNIFYNTYDSYSKGINGYKIDLNKNFRSRNNVIEAINTIFNKLMTPSLGGADYQESHQLITGNTSYKDVDDQNNNIEILRYYKEDNYSLDEVEAFIIAKDIESKIKNKFQVSNKDGSIRDIEYQDITILLDRRDAFDLYKKILEYHKIPVNLYKVIDIKEEKEIFTIKNIIELILLDKNKVYDGDFKRLFVSITRSFLVSYDDEKISDLIANNNMFNDTVYQCIHNITKDIDSMTPIELIERILEDFNYYERLILIGDIESRIMRIDYLKNIIINLSSINNSIEDILNNLKNIFKDEKLEIKLNNDDNPGVKIMTIHASKGLEFPVVYYSRLYKEFNYKDITNNMTYDEEYKIITKVDNNGLEDTIYKYLSKNRKLDEIASEKLRLFYVALTRSKEKIIILENIDKDDSIIYQYRSFNDFMKVINKEFINESQLIKPTLCKTYKNITTSNYHLHINGIDKLDEFEEIVLLKDNKTQEKFSKEELDIITEDKYNLLKFGEYMHYVLETIDFNKPVINVEMDEIYKSKILKLISDLGDLSNTQIYKEYEFIDEQEDSILHGIIDLMIEYSDHIKLIDYKLKNLSDKNYIKQLSGYKNYIEKITNKRVDLYLYSIIDGLLKEVE